MDKKLPIIITTSLVVILIALLVVVFAGRSCNKASDIIPTASSDVSGSDSTMDSSNGDSTTTTPPDMTNATGDTFPSADITGNGQFPTENGEVIVTETTGSNNGSSGGSTKPTSDQTIIQPTSPSSAQTTSGVIELPFVPADALNGN